MPRNLSFGFFRFLGCIKAKTQVYRLILIKILCFIGVFSEIHANETLGYLDYSTCNIGDDIQSIAARKFLPETAIPINREFLHQFYSDQTIHLIMNGWFMHTKKAGWPHANFFPPQESWPPSSSINPLLISIHFTKSFFPEAFSDKGIQYLKEHGPVGARDYSTLTELMNRNIPSYFSGCLTLTLENTENERENILYAVDLDDECVSFIKSRANCKVECISHIMNDQLLANKDARQNYAEQLLKKYQRARCVITSRLHAAMPCLAFKTPVLLINTQSDQYRFDGLRELTHNCSRREFLSGEMNFDFNLPQENPQDYLPLRENLIKTTTQWVKNHSSSW